MLKLVCVSGHGGNETARYRVDFPKSYTVEEFINCVIKERPDEWGIITINGNLKVEYKRGKLLTKILSAYSKYLLVLEIKEATARGGWGLMDYSVIAE